MELFWPKLNLSLPKVIDQYSAENKTCRSSSNCCLRCQNQNWNWISVSL